VPGAEILLVEDDDLNQALVPAILARSDQPHLRDAHVTVAGTLAQARAILAERHIDLVLLDMRLPDGSGLPLATELRDQPGQSAAVIALTGAPAEHGGDALAAGCVAVLGKPYGLGELREVVAAHLPCGEAAPDPAAAIQEAAPAPEAGAHAPSAQASWAGTPEPPAMLPGPQGPGAVGGHAPREPAAVPAARPPASQAVPEAGQPGALVNFELLFCALPGAYMALDPDLRIVAVSDAYARATRAAASDLIGRCVWEALPEDSASSRPGALPGLRASLEQVCMTRSADTMEVQKRFMPPLDIGRGTYEACYFRPVNVPVLGRRGKLCYIIHVLEDVTSQVTQVEQAQQARQAAQDAKTEYVSRVSHELRTPINTILGFGELLSLGDLTAEHREWASMMVKAARHLAAFIDDIADISRAEMHRLSLSIEPVPAGSVIADALDLIRPLSASHGVHLDPPPPAGQHVFADPRRLRQVLLNLLSNAVKYNHPAGRVTVSVDSQPGERLRICIRDTGRGIADYDIGQLFTPFQRLDAAQAGIEGAGLGLTLSRQLIDAMGGSIGATSAPGEGSVFWVELPIAEPAATADATVGADPVVEPRAYTAPKTILYVEDMLETLLLVEHILKQRPSVSLVPAMLGGAALDLAAEYRPHLILLDLNLPDIPGEELLRRLKADPATSATPVIIISGETSDERIGNLMGVGASAYLTKPISVRDFLHTVDSLLTRPAAAGARASEAALQPETAQRDDAKCEDAAPDQPWPE
jgi:signal transduction histidine kinase/DNA-binding response OmpR family regulator